MLAINYTVPRARDRAWHTIFTTCICIRNNHNETHIECYVRLYLLEAPEKATKDLTPGARNANNCFSHAQTGLSHAQFNIVSRLGRYTPWHLCRLLYRARSGQHPSPLPAFRVGPKVDSTPPPPPPRVANF